MPQAPVRAALHRLLLRLPPRQAPSHQSYWCGLAIPASCSFPSSPPGGPGGATASLLHRGSEAAWDREDNPPSPLPARGPRRGAPGRGHQRRAIHQRRRRLPRSAAPSAAQAIPSSLLQRMDCLLRCLRRRQPLLLPTLPAVAGCLLHHLRGGGSSSC